MQLQAPSRKDGAQLECNPNMENLTPTTSTASLDVATKIDDPFKDAPAAPEALSEESPLPASGLQVLAEAVKDGAIVMPDEAAHSAPSEIEGDTPDDPDTRRRPTTTPLRQPLPRT